MSVVRSARALRSVALCSAIAFGASLHAELIPPSRLVNWSAGGSVGVPGGVDQYLAGGAKDRTTVVDVTKSPYSADNTGAVDAGAVIQKAINAAATGSVIYLPPGTYRFDTGIRIDAFHPGITIRGAGESTVIKLYGSASFINIGTSANWTWPTSGNTITAGLTKGSTVVTMADTSGFTTGNNVRFAMANDSVLPVVSVFGYDLTTSGEPMRRQISRVVSKTATTLTISPALYGDYSSVKTVAHSSQLQTNLVGCEDMLVDASQTTAMFTIYMESCYACWIKNLHIKSSYNYHVSIADSLNCEVRHTFLDHLNHSGTNGAALLLNCVAGSLFEDNIIVDAQPLLEVNNGSCGNVFGYNFCDIAPVPFDTNHAPHNAFNLYEGNITPGVMADGYFGGVSDDTFLRNWITGVNNGTPVYSVALKRFTRNYSFAGNIVGTSGKSDGTFSFGQPNIGNASSSGTAQPSKGSDWPDRNRIATITTRVSDSNAVVSLSNGTSGFSVGQWPITARWSSGWRGSLAVLSVATSAVTLGDNGSNNSSGAILPAQGGTFQLWPGPSGFQELDLDVEATTTLKANYMALKVGGGSIPTTQALGTDTLPRSYYRTVAPTWFGNLAWPAFDPSAPNQNIDAIPAGYRYNHGVDPTSTPTSSKTQSPIGARIPPQP